MLALSIYISSVCIYFICPLWASSSLCTSSQVLLLGVKEPPDCGLRQQTKGPCQALQAKKDQSWGVRTPCQQSSELPLERGMKGREQAGWNSELLFAFYRTVSPHGAPLLCVWRKTACSKIGHPVGDGHWREALPALFSHFKNSGEDDAHVLRGILKNQTNKQKKQRLSRK